MTGGIGFRRETGPFGIVLLAGDANLEGTVFVGLATSGEDNETCSVAERFDTSVVSRDVAETGFKGEGINGGGRFEFFEGEISEGPLVNGSMMISILGMISGCLNEIEPSFPEIFSEGIFSNGLGFGLAASIDPSKVRRFSDDANI